MHTLFSFFICTTYTLAGVAIAYLTFRLLAAIFYFLRGRQPAPGC